MNARKYVFVDTYTEGIQRVREKKGKLLLVNETKGKYNVFLAVCLFVCRLHGWPHPNI